MKKDKVVVDILSSAKLYDFFRYLRTSVWKNMRLNNKRNYFLKLNDLVCKELKIDKIEMNISEDGLSDNNFLGNYMYKNVVVIDDVLTINNIEYNQYLTLYEYLCRVRMHLHDKAFFGEYEGVFSEEKMEKISKVFRSVNFGGISLQIGKDEGHPYEDYQYTNKEAREFATTILFEIIRRNYEENDCYDEEFFMSNCNILDNSFVEDAGETYLDNSTFYDAYNMYLLEKFKAMVNRMNKKNVSSIEDKDLFFIVYPSIIKNCDTQCIINGFNEIIKRIYSEDIKIVWDNKGLVVNNNVYSINDIENLLNIVLYECLNDIDKSFRENSELLNKTGDIEKEIFLYKKRWLYSVVCKIDGSNGEIDFGMLNYQSVYRLLNKNGINDILNKSNGSYFPLAKRRKK